MDILGIGPLELLFILIIALIILGPNDMVKAGKTLGKYMRKIVTSPTWKAIQTTSQELKYLPQKLIRDAGLDEIDKDLPDFKQISNDMKIDFNDADFKTGSTKNGLDAWITPANTIEPPTITIPDKEETEDKTKNAKQNMDNTKEPIKKEESETNLSAEQE